MSTPASMPQAWATELRQLLRLALPLAVVQGGQALMGFVDVSVAGRYSAAALAGVGLGNGLFFAVSVLGMGVVMGVDPLIAQAVGAGDPACARRWMWQGAWAALAASAVLTLPLALVPFFLRHSEVAAEVSREASAFLHWRLPGLLPMLLFFSTRAYLQAVERTGALVWTTAVANVANLGLDLLFVLGGARLSAWSGVLHRIPAMGAAGAAVASDLCSVLQLALLAFAIAGHRVEAKAPIGRGFRLSSLRPIAKVGVPVGLHLFLESGLFTVAAVLAARLGKQPSAAHQLALSFCSVTFMLAVGIGTAGSVRVGYAVGARDSAGARRAGWVAFGAGALFMACCASLFALFPRTLASLVSADAGVVKLAVPLLMLAAVFQISDGIQGIGAGVLRGAGESHFTFVANLLAHYGIGLPLAMGLCFAAGKGVVGIWWGLCAGLTAVALALLGRFAFICRREIVPLAHPAL